MDYYSILDVAEDASQDDIKKAFQQLILKHHPDKNPHQDSTMFHRIDEAYRILKDPVSRKEYDSKIFQQSNQTQLIIHDTVPRSEFLIYEDNEVYYYVCKCGGWYILDEESDDEEEYIICCDECSLVIKVINNK